jgi:hypothetical protein
MMNAPYRPLPPAPQLPLYPRLPLYLHLPLYPQLPLYPLYPYLPLYPQLPLYPDQTMYLLYPHLHHDHHRCLQQHLVMAPRSEHGGVEDIERSAIMPC